MAIFRDLEVDGIAFVPHDISIRKERFSPFDLLVSGFKGDIKTSSYFLLTSRSYPLSCDFYIVRLFSTQQGVWRDAVITTGAMWGKIDGQTTPCDWEESVNMLPQAVRVSVLDETLVVVDYSIWKTMIKAKQAEGGIDNGTTET